ncbi:MAG TPA: hypothetical protein VHI78_01035, partial [Bacteroidales bacterium]|nr:hypothetical protein [Bacteroidales bacterium]
MSVLITRSCILCFLCLFAACSTRQLQITILRPATVVLPSSIKRISILPIPGYSSDNHSLYDLDEITIHDTADANQIRMGYLNGIYDMLVNSPRFERVVFSDSSYGRFLDHGQLYWDNLREVCIGDTTDVILLLQKATCRDRNLLTENLGTSYG